jgi:hypothetical protein
MHVRSKHPGVSPYLKQDETSPDSSQPLAASFDEKSNLIGKFNWLSSTSGTAESGTSPTSIRYPVNENNEIATMHSNIPVMMLKIGSYTKLSLFCGDVMARFNFSEQKFVWEIYGGGMLYKMEILFASVSGMSLDIPLDGSVILRYG